ncbi:AI-2E family transporter [Tuwongella immobilis]|uniref:AI-2E family transporter n=1 Tax=Tuwongella immobilis TaxID=692036 RepID=A0A6C2YP72_9BACT|nr:AI-2E family transporter [Tuwongella immobilis]VIP03236.1 Uncharacterized protein OS=Isosphaera pallida (strain ATCC 43644 / DSM 9630 / IS1B) GN=Isop_2922 PE=4 SV=1: UPF0118 [Tuwongella immobilis]VTS03795.1 Uncharacterized protein OS=Isosphaera pallida (strain ATCC 43644 / DSM 9630 / IS1B) GN=Isop_2922 PE=4 SV=1: UPF0118 [Tuwongella immobilis]
MINLNLSKATRIGLNLVAVLGAIALLYLGRSILVPLVFAGLLASILWPAATWLNQRFRLPWFISCFSVIFLLILVSVILFLSFSVAIPQMVQDVSMLNDPIQQQITYTRIRSFIQNIFPFPISPDILPVDATQSKFFLSVADALNQKNVTQALLAVTSYSMTWIWQGVLVLFILLFLLLEGSMLAKRVRGIFGTSLETQSQVSLAFQEIIGSVRAYLLWRTFINIILGGLLGLCYHLLGLKHAWTWAILTMVLSYVPYIGTIVAGIPPIIDAFFSASPVTALVILLGYTVVVTIEGYIIVPMVMGRSMDLNATTVMLACLFWDLIWGTPGLFLAMPLMSSLKAVCMQVPEWRPWGKLMGSHDSEDDGLQRRIAELARRLEKEPPDATQIMDQSEAGDARSNSNHLPG